MHCFCTRSTTGSVGLSLVITAALTIVACSEAADESSPPTAEPAVPDSFVVALETSAGDIEVLVRTAWAPLGAARVHELAEMRFYRGARIYRVNDRYAQFGYSGRPEVDFVWMNQPLSDEPVRASNLRGTVSFARGGPNSRSTILFINRGDNSNLDAIEWRGVLGFPPVGEVRAGMEVVDRLFDEYGEEPMQWEDSIAAVGNDFLDRRFEGLDSIIDVRIVEDWR